MALPNTFNTDIDQTPDIGLINQTRNSRGAMPNQAMGDLFQGVGEGVAGAINFKTTMDTENIQKDVNQGYDQANQPYGTNASDKTPIDLTNGASSIQSLQTAYDQGKVSDTYYYSQLVNMSKQLRAKYPNYENFVDQTIQKVTGVKPANAYRDAVLNDIAKNQSAASDKDKFWQGYVKENEQYIGQVAPDYFSNPDKYSQDDIRTMVVNLKSNNASVEAQNAKVQYMVNQGKLDTDVAGKSADVALQHTVSAAMYGASNTMGLNVNDLTKKLQTFQSGNFSADDLAQVSQQLNVSEQKIKANLLQQMTSPLQPGSTDSYYSILGAKEINDRITTAMQPYEDIKNMIANKDFGLAGYYTRLNGLQGQQDFNKILNSDNTGVLRATNALTQVNPALAQTYLEQNGTQNSIFPQLAPELAGQIAVGADQFNQAIDRGVNSNGTSQDKAAFMNSMIDTNLKSITSGAATPDQLKNAVDSIYSLDSKGHDIFSYVKPEEYSGLFNRMFNPDVTKGVLSSGDPKTISSYYNAFVDRVNAIPEFRKAAAAVEGTADWQGQVKIGFNKDFNRLQLISPTDSIKPGESPGMAARYQANSAMTKNLGDAVNTLNNVFANLDPLLDGMGLKGDDKTKAVQSILQQLHVEMDNGKKDGVFNWINTQLKGQLSQLDNVKNNDAGNSQDFNLKTQTASIDPSALTIPEGSDLTAGMRNNNPGNIKFSNDINWQGQVGPSKNTDQGDPQVVFDNQVDGMRAAAKLVLSKYHSGKETIRELIASKNGWTPGYTPGAEGVATASGFGIDQPLNMNDPDVLQKVLRGIVTQEHGPSSKLYTDDIIKAGVQKALS